MSLTNRAWLRDDITRREVEALFIRLTEDHSWSPVIPLSIRCRLPRRHHHRGKILQAEQTSPRLPSRSYCSSVPLCSG